MPSVALSITLVPLIFPAGYCFPIFQLLISNHVPEGLFWLCFLLGAMGNQRTIRLALPITDSNNQGPPQANPVIHLYLTSSQVYLTHSHLHAFV